MTTQPDQNVLPLTTKTGARYVAVSPDLARQWLEGNIINRALRSAKVNQYARDMTAGRWIQSESAICRTADGKLLNGQHRLHAIIKSGCTVVMLVVDNMPEHAMTNMDMGIARTAADTLGFLGHAHGTLLAAICRQLVLIEDGRIYRDNKVQAVSTAEISAFLDQNPSVKSSLHSALNAARGLDCRGSALGATHFLIAKVNGVTLADHFLHQLSTREAEPAGSAVHAIDSRLREARRNQQTYPTRNFIYLLLKGWAYYAEDKPVRKLSMTPKGEFGLPPVARWAR